jgi:transglutaminase-like putative cysteine protease
MRRRDCLKLGVACIAIPAFAAVYAQPPGRGRAGATINRRLRFTVSLANPKPFELQGQTLWLYVPAATGPTQQLAALTVSMPHERLTDALGHTLVKLEFASFPPLATQLVTLTAEVLLSGVPEPTPLSNPQDWLGAERFIETGDPRIHALAAELKRPTERDTAQAIYAWTGQNLHHTAYAADVFGALAALQRGGGDCTEYACLAVALARANSIPARRVSGYVIERDSVLRAADYHDWAEVYLDGAWRLLDAHQGHWLEPAAQYVAFLYGQGKANNPIAPAQRFRVQGELEVSLM